MLPGSSSKVSYILRECAANSFDLIMDDVPCSSQSSGVVSDSVILTLVMKQQTIITKIQ